MGGAGERSVGSIDRPTPRASECSPPFLRPRPSFKKKNRYLDATSEWTLDYPPLFAYFERGLAQVASLVAPKALTLQRDPVEDGATLAFQRLSVVAADLTLAFFAWKLTTTTAASKSKSESESSRKSSWVPFLLIVASPGLLIVDSIHFQYNAPLIALLLLAVSKAQSGKSDLAAAAAFAALVCYKHLFACLGPLFALHLLGRCLGKGKAAALDAKKGTARAAAAVAASSSSKHALALAAVVAAVVAVAFGPFALSMASLKPLLGRLFPFDRGLLHAYWAANAWALAAGADVALSAVLKVIAPRVEALLPTTTRTTATAAATKVSSFSSSLSSLAASEGSGLASGLVQQTRFAVLPTPTAGVSALCVLLAQAPALLAALRSGFVSASSSSSAASSVAASPKARRKSSSTPSFAAAAQYCLLCAFVWGYHVHEKAILPVLAISAWRAFPVENGDDGEEEGDEEEGENGGSDDGRGIARGPRSYFLLSLPALHALLPLLAPAPAERAAAFLLLVSHALLLLSESAGANPPFSPVEKAAAAGLCALEVACVLAWPSAFPRLASRLPFASLALTSLVCALGVCGCWLSDALRWWRVALFGEGGGGSEGGREGKDRGEKKKRSAAATTKATASASPSLAARRPRRAAAAAASKA